MHAAKTTEGGATLRLDVLGGFGAFRDDVAIRGFVSDKSRALLVYLAVTGYPQRRESLAGLLWGESAADDARASLRGVLHNLRTIVGDHLLIGRDVVAFDRALPYSLDSEAFQGEVQATEGEPEWARLRVAVARYRGDFLAGLNIANAPAFEEWALGERERLRQLALQALHALAIRATARGDWSDGLDLLGRLLALDPWHDDAHRQTMLLLARSGQTGAALAQYERYRQLLTAELGAEPSTETIALAARLRDGDMGGLGEAIVLPAPGLAAGGGGVRLGAAPLPTPPTPILGREEVARQLAAFLDQPSCRLLTLLGPGGVGKTRLALAVAARCAAGFADGAAFVPLAAIDDPALVIPAIGGALDVQEGGGRSPLDRLIAALRERRLLLLLDNFEQVLAAAPSLAELLGACPQLAIVITSRAPLRLRGEQEYHVPPLALPEPSHTVDAAVLSAIPSVALFVQRARSVRPDFAVTADNATTIAAICARLEGLPLAIELAAARIRFLSLEALLARLGQRLSLLTDGARDLPARQRTLRDTIGWSYDLLSTDERRLFRCLAPFVGGATLAAITTVSGGDRLPAAEPLDLLGSLLEKSLLQQDAGATDEPRYTMLETIREYALEQLEASAETMAIHLRHAHYFLALGERAEPVLQGAEQLAWLDALEREHDNLRHALDWLIKRDPAPGAGLPLASALAPFWEARGHLAEGSAFLDEALRRAPHDAPTRATALDGAARLAFRQGEYDAAETLAADALALARASNDDSLASRALTTLGNTALQRGDHALAIARQEESLACARRVGNDADTAHALARLGSIAWDRGDYGRSRTFLEDALDLRRRMGDQQEIAHSLYSLGHVAWCQGDYRAARSFDEESLALGQTLGDRQTVAHALGNLGLVARSEGDYGAARAALEESVVLSRAMGDRWLTTFALAWLGQVALRQGDDSRARETLTESLLIAQAHGMKRALALALVGIVARIDGGRPSARRGLLQQSAQLCGAITSLLASSSVHLDPDDRQAYDSGMAALRARLGDGSFEAAFEAGRALRVDEAVALARELNAEATADPASVMVRQERYPLGRRTGPHDQPEP